MRRHRVISYFFVTIFLLSVSIVPSCKDGVNIFSLKDDISLGQKLSDQIASDPSTYPLVSRDQMPEVYSLLEGIRDEILNTGKLKHAKDFTWEVKVIDDKTLNAFCAPGGYIYFYTGILRFLDTEAEVAGVMGHEMAHADRRHSTKQMTKQYGIQTLLGLVVGENSSMLTKIAAQLAQGSATLAFSRSDEAEADKYSVEYLSATKYDPHGIAGFFVKLEGMGGGSKTPEFLSTHPSHEHRIRDINAACENVDLTGKSDYKAEYQEFKQKYLGE